METVLCFTDYKGRKFSCVVRCDESGWTVRAEHVGVAAGLSRMNFHADGTPSLSRGHGATVEVVP